MPFKLWPNQVRVAWILMRSPRVVILKARQLGISWLCCAYALWHCHFWPARTVLLFSRGQDDADELMRRVSALYVRMPDWLRELGPLARPPNKSEMEWANGSRIKSLPATRHAGSGWTASLVLLDEAAKIQFADDLYAALKPTVDDGAQLVVLSTANGVGNMFHSLYSRASAGTNGFTPIFLPWYARPGRDRAWYEARVAESVDPAKVLENFPATATEAFVASGRVRFEPAWVEAQACNVRPGLPWQLVPETLRSIPGLKVYSTPIPGRKCVIGADVAEGLESGDYSDAVVIDANSWEELATVNGHWEPDEFARQLHALSEAYDAPIAVERNNHGHAVIATLKALKSRRIGTGWDGRTGWLTNVQTKPQMIDLLATALRDGLIVVHSQATLDELSTYRINADGSTGAPGTCHDDRVMSRAIALTFARSLPTPAGPAVVGGRRDAARLVIR